MRIECRLIIIDLEDHDDYNEHDDPDDPDDPEDPDDPDDYNDHDYPDDPDDPVDPDNPDDSGTTLSSLLSERTSKVSLVIFIMNCTAHRWGGLGKPSCNPRPLSDTKVQLRIRAGMYLKLYFFLTQYLYFYRIYCNCISVLKWKYSGGEGKTKSGRGGEGKVYTGRCLHHQVLLKNLADNVILMIVTYLTKKNFSLDIM